MGGGDDVFEANIILRRRRLVYLGVEDLCEFGRHDVLVVTVDRQRLYMQRAE
jgi:hypothetical protein